MLQGPFRRRKLGPVAARMLRDELRDGCELGNGVRRVELLELGARHELRPPRVVRAEEVELAVVERAPEREAHPVGRAALGLKRVAHRPHERLYGALEGDVRRYHEVLRAVDERGKDRAAELALGLLACKRRDALDFGLAFRHEHGLLHRALAPLLYHLGIAHHLDLRAVLLLGHVGIASADHLPDGRAELVDVGRPEKNAGQPALRDAAEIALGRLDFDLLRVVVVRDVSGKRVLHHVGLVDRGEAARLALEERTLRLCALCGAGRDLEENRLRVVEEEVCEILELVGMRILLELADDRAERLRLGKNLDVDVEGTRALRGRAAAKGLAVAVARERLLRAKLALVAKWPLLPELASFAKRFLVSGRRAIALRSDFPYGDSGVLLRPIRGEVKRPERAEVEFR